MLWVGTSWKMNGTRASSRTYVEALKQADHSAWDGVQAFIIPPATVLAEVSELLGPDSDVLLGAQNAHWADAGAWTGEVSVPQVADAGAQLVEVGHSERRANFGDTDEVVNKKVRAIIGHGLRPVLCVGESQEVFDAGDSVKFITDQADSALEGVDPSSVVLAYEPIWAIGEHGREPQRDDLLRAFDALQSRYGDAVTAVIYGGSANPGNARELLGIPGVEGLFIGRAAWTGPGYVQMLGIAGEVARAHQG
ncbi:Triosephosphate isomerase 2 [Propionibacterium freudenreichii]|nr:Triosephosphate isomerase 2 [Propionibacterium freudenreichii]SCQ66071.1 Triosephosphate isomerase 2 [Propionibacterium freudenreichii]